MQQQLWGQQAGIATIFIISEKSNNKSRAVLESHACMLFS